MTSEKQSGNFDYKASAEVYAGRNMRRSGGMKYQRFDTGAEALRYAIEVMPAQNLSGVVIEADEKRYGHEEIRKLYDAREYPLERKGPRA